MCTKRNYMVLSAAFFATFGLVLIKLAVTFEEKAFHETAYLTQISNDWDTVPFVNLTVTHSDSCPFGSEEVIYKPWYGTKHLCVCSAVGWWTTREGECTRNSKDDISLCYNLPALSPVIQAQFSGVRVCGSRDGKSFLEQTRVGKDGKCPQGTEACIKNASPENTICYPTSDLKQMCPITSIDVIDVLQAQTLKAQGYSVISLNNNQALVYSKSVDSMPPTSMRVEFKPCMTAERVSSAPGTVNAGSEIMKTDECAQEINTKLTFDDRYTAAKLWQTTEGDIMKENGVYERLYKEEIQDIGYLLSKSWSNFVLTRAVPKDFDWGYVRGYERSQASRSMNKQQLWTRPTISWSLHCDRDVLSRQEASEVFSQRLDTLGFIQYVLVFGIAIVVLTIIPILVYLCSNESTGKVFVECEPYFTRLIFAVFFITMLQFVNSEREQAVSNTESVQRFKKTNECSTQHTKIDTEGITTKLGHALESLNTMEICLWVAFSLVALEILVLFCTKVIRRNRGADQLD